MKRKKGKGSGSKHKKAAARFKTVWLRDDKDVKRLIVPKPDVPNTELKESAKNMADAFPHSHEDLIKDTGPPKPSKKKASVTHISEARKGRGTSQPAEQSLAQASIRQRARHIINTEAHVYKRWSDRSKAKDWYIPKSEESARDTLEIKLKLSHKIGHWVKESKQECALVGPPAPENINHNPGIKQGNGSAHSLPQPRAANGYSFANKERKVTRCNKPPSVMGKKELERQARNDPDFTPSVADVKWYINNVQPQDWPDIIRENTYYVDSGYRPDKSKLLGAAAPVGKHTQLEYEELERDHASLQVERWNEKVEMLERINSLNEQLGMALQELSFARDQLKVAELHSVTSGNTAKASDKGKPPLSTLANQFNIFNVQWRDNPLHAFCASRGIDIESERKLRGYFDWQCEGRLKVSEYRAFYKRLSNYTYHSPRKAVRVRQEIRALRRIKSNNTKCKLHNVTPAAINIAVTKERLIYERWANRKSTPRWLKYLDNQSKFDKLCMIEHNRQLMESTTYKVLKGLKDALLTEVNPWERKRLKAEAKRKVKAKRMAVNKQAKLKKEQASRIKRMAEDKHEADVMRQRIREAQRIAY